jgi:hypothetical protein
LDTCPGPDTCRRDRRPGESKQGQAWPLRCLFRRRANSSPPQSLRQARLRAARPGLACTFFPSTALSATSWSSVARGRGIRPSVRRTRGIASFRNLTAAGAIPARTLPSLEWDAYQHEPVTCVIPGARLCELHHPRPFKRREFSAGQDIVRNQFRRVHVAFVVGFAVADSQARVAQTGHVDTFEMMKTAKQMPSEHFADYSFVF